MLCELSLCFYPSCLFFIFLARLKVTDYGQSKTFVTFICYLCRVFAICAFDEFAAAARVWLVRISVGEHTLPI